MKITDSEVIKNSEKELIDAITGDLDWEAIENVFKKKHSLSLEDDVEYKDGDLVIYNNAIAYKLNFDVRISLSVLFDRQGDCLDITTPNINEKTEGEEVSEDIIEDTEPVDDMLENNKQDEKQGNLDLAENGSKSEKAEKLSKMILEINKE